MSIQKKCNICGKEFTAKNDKGIYCSKSCRVKAFRKREKVEKTELEKNISENYAEELSFFKMRLNSMYEDVHKLQTEMLSVTKYMMVFAEKIGQIPQREDTTSLKERISDLSERIEDKIEKMNLSNEEKIEKNEYNIRLIGLKITEIANAINRINERTGDSLTPKADVINKILNSDMIPDLVDKFVNRKPKTADKINEAS